MRFQRKRKAFTLMEVNLAIFIMAVGLLAMVALYPLAYRESRQSKDDVVAAAAADYILNSLTAALSSRNIKWSDWVQGVQAAEAVTGTDDYEGRWLAYCDWQGNSREGAFVPKRNLMDRKSGKAQRVFDALANIYNRSPDTSGTLSFGSLQLPDEYVYAIVAQWGQIPVYDTTEQESRPVNDLSRVAIGVRVARRAGDILGQPLFYTEIHFQGDQHDLTE